MHDPAYGLRRIPLLRTPVNRGKKRRAGTCQSATQNALVAGKRPQDIDVVPGGDRHQFIHVGWLLWRYAQLLGRLAHFHGKLSKPAG